MTGNPARQTIEPAGLGSAVRQAMERLAAARTLPRIWSQDASLWSAEPEAQLAIRQRLGWLTIARLMAQRTPALRRLAQELREAGLTHALLLGMGGSGVFAEVCRHTLGLAPGHLDLAVLDTVDPAAIRAHAARCPPDRLCVIVSSKSGSTIEIASLGAHFYEFLKSSDHPGARCLAITDAGTSLEAQAAARQFRRIFTHGAGTGAEVGGRFSALSFFGLVPAALIGADVDRLVSRAEAMMSRCAADVPLEENPAAGLGAALAASLERGRDKLTLLCAPGTAPFGTWLEQLIAESFGKGGRGIVPVDGELPLEPGAYGPDRLFVELRLAGQREPARDDRLRRLLEAGHPVIRIAWQDPYDLGGEVFKWALATAAASALIGINPFDEPNVQESKDRTKRLLQAYAQQRILPEGRPCCGEGEVDVYAPADDPGPPAECLGRFFRRRQPGDYLALLSFLPRTAACDEAVAALRARLAARLGLPTMAQVGPRYLHSTGQLFKGGPNTGLFLLLTADEGEDLPIPGEPYTFGILKRAQALGDFEAMQQKGRRILRLHLRGGLERARQELSRLLDDALRGCG
jgi:glucose-6-phosphate isomerase/transaldolase/glucose-6-phosphate isomerase